MKKVLSAFGYFVAIVIIIFGTYSGITLIVSNLKHCDYKYIYEPMCQEIEFEELELTYTKEKAKNEIEKLTNAKLFIYKECDLEWKNAGLTTLSIRLVRMQQGLSVEEYIFYYTHELVHLTECVANEIYTQFRAWQILYESGNAEFKAVAMRYLYKDMIGYDKEEYTYWHYAKQYLVQKGKLVNEK